MGHLTELRCPRSSGGSFRSLTASITADRRSTNFFSVFSDLPDGEEDSDNDDDEEEARLSVGPPPWPTAIAAKVEFSGAGDLRSRDDEDDDIVLVRRIAMARFQGCHFPMLPSRGETFVGFLGGKMAARLFPRVAV